MAFSGATGGLSTQKAASPKLLSVRHANHTDRSTGLSALQVAVFIQEKAVVHKKWLALLLLLFIYKTLKEQPKNILGAQNRGGGCQNGVEMTRCLPPKWPLEKRRPCSAASSSLRKPPAGSAGVTHAKGRGWVGQTALQAPSPAKTLARAPCWASKPVEGAQQGPGSPSPRRAPAKAPGAAFQRP